MREFRRILIFIGFLLYGKLFVIFAFYKFRIYAIISKMETADFLQAMNSGEVVYGNSPLHRKMIELSQEAIRITIKLNTAYHTPEEIVEIFMELTGRKPGEGFSMFPPFYTDCGKNIHIGARTFINSGCKFQDQGGIYIGEDVLIGHNAVIATLNHLVEPSQRSGMIPKPVKIGDKVWIGANVTILPGVSIGENSIIGAGSVVTKDIPANSIAVGNPARIIKHI